MMVLSYLRGPHLLRQHAGHQSGVPAASAPALRFPRRAGRPRLRLWQGLELCEGPARPGKEADLDSEK